jgi:hypothetical protein
VKDIAIDIVASLPAGASGLNVLREYVQSRILGSMQSARAMGPLAFMGGTALRFVYRVPRYSEDLDFTYERMELPFSFRDMLAYIRRDLEGQGYEIKLTLNDTHVVEKSFIGFVGLLAEAGLSPHVDQVLWVKLEVDTNPPAAAGLDVSRIDRFGPLRIQHHNLPTLFAGKLAALLCREYTKGRDLYDLMWYLMRVPPLEPNGAFLEHALRQSRPELAGETSAEWTGLLRGRLAAVHWADARRDVAPFLEDRRGLELIAFETFEDLLAAR